MATSFGQAWVFAIKFCHDYGIQMTDQQMHDFCNLLIEFRDGSRQTQDALDGATRPANSDHSKLVFGVDTGSSTETPRK